MIPAIKDLIIMMRIRKWFVNVVVLLHAIFLNKLSIKMMTKSILGAIIFCYLSSAIYIINNLYNSKEDFFHPTYHKRAAVIEQYGRFVFLSLISLIFLIFVPISFIINFSFGTICLLFILWEFLYSIFFRKIFLLDILSIGIGYILRAIGGAFIIGMHICLPIIFFVFFLSSFILLCKRRQEFMLAGNIFKYRRTLARYSIKLFNLLIALSILCTLISYIFITFINYKLIFSLPFLIYGILRYVYIIYFKNKGAFTEELFYSDKLLLLNFAAYALTISISSILK